MAKTNDADKDKTSTPSDESNEVHEEVVKVEPNPTIIKYLESPLDKINLDSLPEDIRNDPFIKDLIKAQHFADIVVESKAYGHLFTNIVYEEDGITIKGYVKDRASVITCITLGLELGLSPAIAIALNKQLNADAALKVIKGKSLGLDTIASLQNISIIRNRTGNVTYHTGVHIISGALDKLNVKREILEDAVPIYRYWNRSGKHWMDDPRDTRGKLPDDYYLYEGDLEAAKKAVLEKKVIVERKIVNKRTTIKFTRESTNTVIEIPYTLQQAIDAGLLRGYHSELTDEEGKALYVAGKDNWNNNPERMLRNRVISIGGNFIAADKLNGMYTEEEIEDVLDTNPGATIVPPIDLNNEE